MIQKKSVKAPAVLLALIFAVLTGCDSASDADTAPTNPFIGSWAYVQAEDTSIAAGTYRYSFEAADYMFTYIAPEEMYTLQYEAGTYTWDESTITMTPTKILGIAAKTPSSTVSSYAIRDSVLTLNDGDYGSTDYRRE